MWTPVLGIIECSLPIRRACFDSFH